MGEDYLIFFQPTAYGSRDTAPIMLNLIWLLFQPKIITIVPDPPPQESVLDLAQHYVDVYGTRPYWNREPLDPDKIKDEDIKDIIARLIACESENKDVKVLDSNNYYSYGRLQYQKRTWEGWEQDSGIQGNPMIGEDAVRMAEWAIPHGKLPHWSCSYILHILKK